jgi:hypothetical protein
MQGIIITAQGRAEPCTSAHACSLWLYHYQSRLGKMVMLCELLIMRAARVFRGFAAASRRCPVRSSAPLSYSPGRAVAGGRTDRDKYLDAGCDDYDTKPVESGGFWKDRAPARYRRGVGRDE